MGHQAYCHAPACGCHVEVAQKQSCSDGSAAVCQRAGPNTPPHSFPYSPNTCDDVRLEGLIMR